MTPLPAATYHRICNLLLVSTVQQAALPRSLAPLLPPSMTSVRPLSCDHHLAHHRDIYRISFFIVSFRISVLCLCESVVREVEKGDENVD